MYPPLNNLINGKIITNGKINNNNIISTKYFLFLISLTFIFCLYFLLQIWPNNSHVNYKIIFNKKLINSSLLFGRKGLEECNEDDKNKLVLGSGFRLVREKKKLGNRETRVGTSGVGTAEYES